MPSAEIKTHLDGTSSLAVFIKITATDGDIIAVTNATRKKTIDGVTYNPVPLRPSQLSSSQGLQADNAELSSVLSGLYTSATLRAKKWMGARVEYAVYNYKDISMGPAIRKVGYIGETELGKYAAKPELMSLSDLLGQSVGQTMLETCNVKRLGDTRCGVTLTGNTVDGYRIRTTAQIASITNQQQFTLTFTQTIKPADAGVTTAPNSLFDNGEVEFTSGANDGLETVVLTNTGNLLTLWLPPFYDLAVGDTLIVTVGCSRKIDQCVSRFDNGINFRGYWMLPGREKLFKIPE